MPTLLDLPNEILSDIMKHIHPGDIESLVASCNTFATLGKEKLKLHLQRKERYTHLTLYGCHRHKDNPHPLAFLCDICQDDDLAYYPASLNLECCEAVISDFNSGLGEKRKKLMAQSSRRILDQYHGLALHETLQNSYIDKSFAEIAAQSLEDGDRGTVFGLLLILLPNLEILAFDKYPWNLDSSLFDRLFKQIVGVEDKIRWGLPGPANRALIKLTQVDFAGGGDLDIDIDNPRNATRFGTLGGFATIPSLRAMNVVDSDLRSLFVPVPGPLAFGSSNLESMSLVANRDVLREAESILKGCRALKHFTWHRGSRAFDATDEVLDSLLRTAVSSSLKSLFVLGFENYSRGDLLPYSADIDYLYIDYLSCFGSLEDLRLPCNLLLKEIPEPQRLMSQRGTTRRSSRGDRSTQMLPTSLQRLELDGQMDIGAISKFAENIVKNRTKWYPQLQKITLYGTNATESIKERLAATKLRRACSDVGILLDLR